VDEAYLETKLRNGVASLASHEESDEERLPEARSVETDGHSQTPIEECESNQSNLESSEKTARTSLELLSWGVQEPLPPEQLRQDL